MQHLGRRRIARSAALVLAAQLAAGAALAFTAPYSTPAGITLVDVSKIMDEAIPQFLWRRLGDAQGHPLYTRDADALGGSSCYAACAKEFPPLVAAADAKPFGDWSISVRADRLRQWVYQGKPLYRYAGNDPEGEPVGARFERAENPAWHDPASDIYSPKPHWRRAAYTPEKSTPMPPNVEIDGLAVANGFGFVDASTHLTIYAAPVAHALDRDWRPVRASALALPVGEFAILRRKDDGTRQWTYKGEALYTYAGDYAPGEVNGIFTGDHSIEAALAYRNFLPPGIRIGDYAGRGPLLTTANGLTLYSVARYQLQYGGRETRTGYAISYNDAKSQGTIGCEGACTTAWRPLLATADAQARGFWELIARADGSRQWAFKGSPVYSYVGDRKPGDVEGNNRHVIVYGGAHGQIVYGNPGASPRDPRPHLGTLDMPAAVGPKHRDDEDADDAAQGAGQRDAATPAHLAPIDDRSGAGFYWHTASLFY